MRTLSLNWGAATERQWLNVLLVVVFSASVGAIVALEPKLLAVSLLPLLLFVLALTVSRPLALGLIFLASPVIWISGTKFLVLPAYVGLLGLRLLFGARFNYSSLRGLASKIPWRQLLLFVGGVLASAIMVRSAVRIITYIYNLGMLLSGILLYVVVVVTLRKERELRLFVGYLTVFTFLVSLIGVLQWISPTFWSSMRNPLEDLLSPVFSGRLGQQILFRLTELRTVRVESLGAGIGGTRIYSIFVHPNHLASVLAMLLPLVWYHSRGIAALRFRVFDGMTLVLAVLALVGTLSRGAWVALGCGLAYWWLLGGRPRSSFLRRSLGFLIILGGVFLLNLLVGQLTGVHYLSSRLYSGQGSIVGRKLLYSKSLWEWLHSPLIGYGTQRDFLGPEVPPLGSHSTLLGVLYRHGILGFVGLVWFVANLWRGVYQKSREKQGNLSLLCVSLSTSLVIFLAHSVVHDWELDPLLFYTIWSVFGMVSAAGSCDRPRCVSSALEPSCERSR